MKKRVGVIMGGPSAEREVALASGRRVAEALAERGHSVASLDWTGADQNLWADLRRERVEVAFVALHGTLGEDGCIQGLLECAGIPYTGSGVLASALAMDKVASRRVFMEESIETKFRFRNRRLLQKQKRMQNRLGADFGLLRLPKSRLPALTPLSPPPESRPQLALHYRPCASSRMV